MRTAHRYFVLLLCASLLNLTLLAGCATTGGPAGSAGDDMDTPQRAQTVDEKYVQRLLEKPPEELTAEEIAYLEMVEERKQSQSLSTMTALMAGGLGLTVLGTIIAIAVGSSGGGDNGGGGQ
jgi:type IV pilus biogenesis protein CpaD/CtpE